MFSSSLLLVKAEEKVQRLRTRCTYIFLMLQVIVTKVHIDANRSTIRLCQLTNWHRSKMSKTNRWASTNDSCDPTANFRSFCPSFRLAKRNFVTFLQTLKTFLVVYRVAFSIYSSHRIEPIPKLPKTKSKQSEKNSLKKRKIWRKNRNQSVVAKIR